MKLFLHAFNTWLVAHLLHPLIFAAWYVAVSNEGLNMASFFLLFFIISVFLSIPAFFVLWPLLYLISKGPFSVSDKLFLWVVVILLLLFASFSFFLFFSDGGIKWEEIEFMLPAALSAILSTLLRRTAFLNLQMTYSIK